MPFTVITLKKVPDSLRGDLTRWMQEIATGVYVGSYNSRVREYLWKRVTDTVGQGEATMCYSCRNEIGYSFSTCNTEREVVDSDGIPLVIIPDKESKEIQFGEKTHGFSNASKFHHAIRKVCHQSASTGRMTMDEEATVSLQNLNNQTVESVVFIDLETTGLETETDQIIEIGAVKMSGDKEFEFHRLIRADVHLPEVVSKMTGITEDMLSEGVLLEDGVREFAEFIRGSVLVGYNISFDIKFLNRAFEKYSLESLHNKTLDLMHEAKKRNGFQVNYKFETTLKEYGIDQVVQHRALEDAKLMHKLYNQMGLG